MNKINQNWDIIEKKMIELTKSNENNN